MNKPANQLPLLEDIVDRISVGIFVVNIQNELVLWNSYMENYSQAKASDVLGKNLFEAFPELPRNWLEQKIHNVFVIKNFSFTSWEHRPYLFKFLHNRPITGGVDYMRQNCTFLPIKGNSGEIEFVCVTIFDVTDTSIYENMLKNAVRSLAEASNRDSLTGIYNRRYLEAGMSKEFSRMQRYGGTLSFILIDLDHFKAVNDNYGHLAGDEILKIAAQRINHGLRGTDTLCRYGGEEFAIMLPETPIDGAETFAQRLCDDLSASPIEFAEHSITITASVGLAEFDPSMETHEAIIGRADDMLYQSKANGRNQVTAYRPKTMQTASTTEAHTPELSE
ncbi:MAG TPA: diguanylate cyclase, partial [Gammaproteobacteria bacterium]|nr:diguanylate cyclase [Gammaproteobacteria bacterium]